MLLFLAKLDHFSTFGYGIDSPILTLSTVTMWLLVVVVVTFFNHNFVNCKATLILAIKIYEIEYNISLNDIHT